MPARKYRIRLYDDGADVTEGREWMAILDLDDGPGLASARADLDALLVSLARADGASGRRLSRYYLGVHDWHDDEQVALWPPRWHDDREDEVA